MNIKRLYRRNRFLIFLFFCAYISFWLTLNTLKRFIDPPELLFNRLKFRSNGTFYFIINQLFQLQINIILIDPYVLNHLFVERLPFDKVDRQFITFAIVDKSVNTFFQSLQDSKFTIQTSKSVAPNRKTSVDHIFIEYQYITVHLAVLHKYNTYFRIHKNHHQLSNGIELPYGDKLRAVDHFETELHEYLFYYPRNVSHFLWLYNVSEFVRCNRTLAKRMRNEFNIRQNLEQLSTILKPMIHIANGLDQLQKHHWIAGGALLGWYRHCGLIPDAEDIDFGLFAEEYDESIRNYFLGNPVTHIWAALGLVNDSLEFRLSSGRYVIDLFWTYREGNTRWYGYQAQRSKYRRTLPMFSQLCSGDLYGYRFSVPCSPVAYLDHEYGKEKWITPLKTNYKWINMQYHSMWNDISWMYAVRLYSKEGKLRSDELAISWIAKRFNYTYTSVPSFLNVLPNETVTLPPLKKELVQNISVVQSPKSTRKKKAEQQENNENEEEERKEEEDEEKPKKQQKVKEKPKEKPQVEQPQNDEEDEKPQEEEPIEEEEEEPNEDEEDEGDEPQKEEPAEGEEEEEEE